jgi:hypothetical protein
MIMIEAVTLNHYTHTVINEGFLVDEGPKPIVK